MGANIPEGFRQELQALLGNGEAEALIDALCGEPSVSIRLHPAKTPEPMPGDVPLEGTPVPWCAEGRKLSARPSFILAPRWHAGAYYVQEAASQVIAHVYHSIIDAEKPEMVLDLCAAPGGKATLWRELLPDNCVLVANEPVGSRNAALQENLVRWGRSNVLVTQAEGRAFAHLGGIFDVIAVDMPCSGEGMFRKDGEAREQWSENLVERCAARQWNIICDVWPALREGGYLVYSTCTFNRKENEEIALRIVAKQWADPVVVPTPEAWGIATDPLGEFPSLRFYPHRTAGEGFTLCVLRKTGFALPRTGHLYDRASRLKTLNVGKEWLSKPDSYIIYGEREELFALPQESASLLVALRKMVRTTLSGLHLGSMKGRKLVPSAALALSLSFRKEAFPQVVLDHAGALAYLRREVVGVGGIPKGYVVATYAGLPLGFLNNLGIRANNLYPAAWRIRRALPSGGH